MFMKVLCCILMLASYVVVYIQIRLEDKWYYGAIYEAEKIRYERAYKEEAMTRKEAIKILDEQHLMWTMKEAEAYCMEVNKAIDMAIEALKEEPKLNTGKWIKATGMMPPEFHGHHCCSECGNFANMEPPFGNREDLSNFCPNCGADMRGEEDD